MDGSLEVASADHGLLLRVRGFATGRVSVTTHGFIRQSLAAGMQSVALDLSQADGIDSTFIGGLILLRQRQPRERVCLGPPSATVAKVFTSMRLADIIQATDSLPTNSGPWLPVPLTEADNKQFGQHVLECHLRLAEQDGPQSGTFRTLVERLRQELERQ